MLFDLLLNTLSTMLYFLQFAIPNWFIPLEVEAGFVFMIERILEWNQIFPLASLLLCLSMILWFHILRLTFNLLGGLISIVRGGGELKV